MASHASIVSNNIVIEHNTVAVPLRRRGGDRTKYLVLQIPVFGAKIQISNINFYIFLPP